MTTNKQYKRLVNYEERIMNEGRDAALRSDPRESNPYPANHAARRWWDLGWLEIIKEIGNE